MDTDNSNNNFYKKNPPWKHTRNTCLHPVVKGTRVAGST